MDIKITIGNTNDIEAVLSLNEAANPHVNHISKSELTSLIDSSFYFGVARDEEIIAGFIIALPTGLDYQSQNYRWFSQQYDKFIYIDRIVISDGYQGCGIGGDFYKKLEELSVKAAPALSCEVNLRPPNPNSLAFHHNLGFNEVGQQDTCNGANRVSLLYKIVKAKL
jgi:predicted GNAT superfamily acetyltransferase